MTPAEATVYRALLDGQTYLPDLARKLWMSESTVAAAVLTLEGRKLVKSSRVGKYRMARAL